MSAATLQGTRYTGRHPELMVGLSVYDAAGTMIVETGDLGVNAYRATEVAAHLIGHDVEGIIATLGELLGTEQAREASPGSVGGVAAQVYVEHGTGDDAEPHLWASTLDVVTTVQPTSQQLVYYTSDDGEGDDGPWSVYSEVYTSPDADQPIDGTARFVSRHPDRAAADDEAQALQHQADLRRSGGAR